jgi:acetyltransferase
MSIHNLDKIFKPGSVAIIGASERNGSIGSSLVKNLSEAGYEGNIFPVNPRHKFIQGLPAYSSIRKIREPIDLAVVALPLAKAPSVVKECVKAGVAGAIIGSADGKKLGSEEKRLEQQIKKEAAKGDLRIIGPNCTGIFSLESKLNAGSASLMPLPGKLAFISQSGAICSAILDLSLKEGIGFRYFVNVGSMLDVDFGDLINYMGNDSQVSSIALYIESLTDIRKFMSAARAVSRVKPIVVLKAGKSRDGTYANPSHSAVLTAKNEIYNAAFKRAGIVRVDTVEELFDCAELMAKQPVPTGPGLAIITNGGGPGLMAADALSSFGLQPASLTRETINKLEDFLPSFRAKKNPINIMGDASPERWQRTLEVCFSAPEIYALVIILVPQIPNSAREVAQAVVGFLHNRPFPPMFAVWMGGETAEEGRRILNTAGIPTYETPERAVSAFMSMYSYARNLKILQEIPPKLDHSLKFDRPAAKTIIDKAVREKSTQLTEAESKALLKAYGIPVNRTEVAKSPEEAIRLAEKIGFPVAMKIHSRDTVHKTDAHGVRLNLHDKKDVEEAFSNVMAGAKAHYSGAELLGVTIQAMLKHQEYELTLGAKKDTGFGPVLFFGSGGIAAGILKDRAIALPPLNRLLARRLMESTRVYHMLKADHKRTGKRLEFLEEILIRLSQFMTDFPEIEELEINPLILTDDQACAVDARVIIKPSETPSPLHLVISPYPNQYEMTATTKGGLRLFIRPIKPEDAPLLEGLFNTLSEQSVYYRFFTPMKTLSRETIAYFTQIDYDRDIALVAIHKDKQGENILGVARLMTKPGGTDPEFAVTVGDPWQGKGVGAALMESLLNIAKERGVESIWGSVLGVNTHMLALARKLGFHISRVPRRNEYKLSINFGSMASGKQIENTSKPS